MTSPDVHNAELRHHHHYTTIIVHRHFHTLSAMQCGSVMKTALVWISLRRGMRWLSPVSTHLCSLGHNCYRSISSLCGRGIPAVTTVPCMFLTPHHNVWYKHTHHTHTPTSHVSIHTHTHHHTYITTHITHTPQSDTHIPSHTRMSTHRH